MFPPFLIDPAFWFSVAIAAAMAKVLCTVISFRWPGGAKGMLISQKGKFVYFAGKVTPVIAVGAVLVRAKLSDQTINPAWSVLVFTTLIVVVAFIVWLRLTNRWYGVAYMVKSRRPRDGG